MSSLTSFLKTKIINSVDDLVGVVLTNVKKEKNNLNFQGINYLYDLDFPSAERIKKIPMLSIFINNNYTGDNFE